jgi:hypothetical protein
VGDMVIAQTLLFQCCNSATWLRNQCVGPVESADSRAYAKCVRPKLPARPRRVGLATRRKIGKSLVGQYDPGHSAARFAGEVRAGAVASAVSPHLHRLEGVGSCAMACFQ